jgi:hypothetical protein
LRAGERPDPTAAATASTAWSRKVRNSPERGADRALLVVAGDVRSRAEASGAADHCRDDGAGRDGAVLDADLEVDAGRREPVGDASLGSSRRARAVAAIRAVTARATISGRGGAGGTDSPGQTVAAEPCQPSEPEAPPGTTPGGAGRPRAGGPGRSASPEAPADRPGRERLSRGVARLDSRVVSTAPTAVISGDLRIGSAEVTIRSPTLAGPVDSPTRDRIRRATAWGSPRLGTARRAPATDAAPRDAVRREGSTASVIGLADHQAAR